MYIARRTGGGRGVYEVAGTTQDNLSAAEIASHEARFFLQVTPFLILDTKLILKGQGGKPRLSRVDKRAIQIQRSIAALLLLPKPIRADEAMETGLPVLQAEAYAIETLEMAATQLSNDKLVFSLSELQVKNTSHSVRINFPIRFKRVASLWAKKDSFPQPIADLLLQHEDLVLADRFAYPELEQISANLQTEIAQMIAGGQIEDEKGDMLEMIDFVPLSLTAALCTKPFAILTGPSGTGKSKTAIELATAFDYGPLLPENLSSSRTRPATNIAFVPVGAGWTDQNKLLGYRNPFGPKREANGQETNLTYQITETLKLILRASHPHFRNSPHFLILDEMNLSHVEHYFSSFLSLMEANRNSRNPGQFELIDQDTLSLVYEVLQYEGIGPMEAEAAWSLLEEGKGLSFPSNLFIIGTVNVDETTYMFSPKVLDRAFVIELNSVRPSSYIKAQQLPDEAIDLIPGNVALEIFEGRISESQQHHAGSLSPEQIIREMSGVTGITENQADEIVRGISLALDGIYKLLAPVGFGYGFRITNEVFWYIALRMEAIFRAEGSTDNTLDDWHKALDAAILMKVLPKIHGNTRQLGDSLKALANFLEGPTGPQPLYQIGTASKVSIQDDERLDFNLPRSQEKAEQLHHVLQATGHTTFIS